MNLCDDCKYAVWDYEEYYGGVKRWFFDHCFKDLDPDDNCEGYERYEGEE